MSAGPLTMQLPSELVDAIAAQVAERLDLRGPEAWVGVPEAAEHLNCPRSRIYELVRRQGSDRLPHRKEGSRLLFRCSELDAYLERVA